MSLAPPPDGACFPTWADCYRFVQAHAASEGFAVNSKGQAKSKDTGLYRRYVIRCDKSGRFKSSAQIGVRRISSKKTDCPFSAACNIRADGCYLRVLQPNHNHPPSLPATHTQHRKLTDEQRQLVETRAVERKSIKVIWSELKEVYPNTLVTFKDVDNAVQRFRKKVKDGATGVQAIMYKLVERQDLYCFTLEREGVVQGAFWVPHWSTDIWMRQNGTPDILVMLSEHIANRPVLPILEMNSVLNTAGVYGIAPSGRALPNDPVNPNINPELNPLLNLASSDDLVPNNDDNNGNGSSGNSEGPTPHPTSTASSTHNASNDIGRSNGVLDYSLGAGYAILPDKKDATILWLRSAVDMLRQRIQAPKPRFLTLTDFQTAEKNILLETSKGGAAHRQMHIVFGRILSDDGSNPAHHGVKSRKPRVEVGHRRGADGMGGEDDEGEDEYEDEGQGDDDGEQEEEVDEDDEDQDMDGDHDSDAEIARQLTVGQTHNLPDNHNDYNNPNQNVGQAFSLNPQQQQQQLDVQQPHNHNPMASRLPPPSRARHPAMPAQPQIQLPYDPMNPQLMGGRLPPNMMPPGQPPGQQRRQQ